MNSMNIDENTMNNIKNMVDNGNISDAISQISPEMIQNFSKMFAGQNSNSDTNNNNSNQVSNNENINYNEKNSSNTHSESSEGLNLRANLLNSLKPYLRDSKKSQLDNYMNLLNVSKIAELMKKSENSKNNNN